MQGPDIAQLARYPFLAESRQWVKLEGQTLGDIVSDPTFERVRRRAVARVRGSLEREGIADEAVVNEVDAFTELLSYPLGRALVATIEDAYMRSRYAVAESKLLSDRLRQDEPGMVRRVAGELAIPVREGDDGKLRLHFLEFLKFAPGRDPAWKLVNQPLERGEVLLDNDRLIRLCEEALKDRLQEELEELERPGRTLTKVFERDLNEIRTLVAAHRARFAPDVGGPVRPEAFPPCIQAIWKGIAGHVNIPHMGRFAIVSFLHTLGMSSEDVLRYFATLPDFDVNKSRYQIEHITGQIGATQYTPPSCSTMQTYGICPLDQRDDLCLNVIHHPLSYYRKKVRWLPPPKAPAAVVAEVKDAAPAAGTKPE